MNPLAPSAPLASPTREGGDSWIDRRSSIRRVLLVLALLVPCIARSAEASAPLGLYVAPDGSDTAPGTADRPFRSLERARDEVRALRARLALPEAGVEVRIQPGVYPVTRPFRLEAADSGTPKGRIVYRAASTEAPRFHAGARLERWRRVDDPELLARLPEEARGRVWETDVGAAGLSRPLPFELGGFSSGRGFRTHPVHELFVDDRPMTIARWPNDEFVKTEDVPGPLTLSAWDRRPGSPEGRFRFAGDRPLRWRDEPDAWLYGYWFWDWADSYEKIERIDTEAREIHLAKPWTGYGYRKGQRYHAVNVFAEIDRPGEWYLDRPRNRAFLCADTDPGTAATEISVLAGPLLEIVDASHVSVEGLLWECGAADGIHLRGGESVLLRGCTVRKMAGNGIDIRGGRDHRIVSCDIHTLGRGGIAMSGGDRRELVAGGFVVENCHIHHLSRIDHTYTPAVWMEGVGHRLRHNLVHHVASSAFRVEGNDHLVELNEVHRVVLESDDQGAVDMFGNATYRGNVYRHNYWHHLGAWDGTGDTSHGQRAGIRLDDAICGVHVYGNVFQRCSTGKTHFGGVQIHGGKENVVEGNLFVDTAAAVSFTPWGEKRWREFVAKALDSPAIGRALYLERYPALARLADRPDINTVTSNVTLRCPTLFLRRPAGTESAGNREFPDGTELREGPDGRLVWAVDEAQRLGIAAIPFSKIGLYADAWRVAEGSALLLRGHPKPR